MTSILYETIFRFDKDILLYCTKKAMEIIASILTIAITNGHNHAMKQHGANMDQFFHKEALSHRSPSSIHSLWILDHLKYFESSFHAMVR